jgi:hypothetical protein
MNIVKGITKLNSQKKIEQIFPCGCLDDLVARGIPLLLMGCSYIWRRNMKENSI